MAAFPLFHSKDGLIMKHIHIIGIGGTFMGGVAAIAKEAGFKVSGCDAKMYPPMSTQLEALGIDVHEGFDAAQLDEFKADVYVIGNVAIAGRKYKADRGSKSLQPHPSRAWRHCR